MPNTAKIIKPNIPKPTAVHIPPKIATRISIITQTIAIIIKPYPLMGILVKLVIGGLLYRLWFLLGFLGMPPYPHRVGETGRRYASELDVLTGGTHQLTPSPVCMWELHPRKFKDIPCNKVYRFSLSSLLGVYKTKTLSQTEDISILTIREKVLNLSELLPVVTQVSNNQTLSNLLLRV